MNDTSRSNPPIFVPTLTEVVRPETSQTQTPIRPSPIANLPLALPAEFANLLEGWPVGPNTSPQPVAESSAVDVTELSPAVLERILLRVELTLESRLQATVDNVVESHVRSFKAALKAQISEAILDAVKNAVRQETSASLPDSFRR